ncbi:MULTISPECIES: hypothetical protein [unclassified Herbaspirillum]|uniref:hypothetical protein n=1 Tax=unclassified Herbaspirillum TaxID=2624150 RepID=UPI00116A72C6|nr:MULTISPECIES: hypothetical protein [unclassified Herbaspirillum]MBB5393616.1 hypothetical protein [Herbaspirillum sp. SJZ102]TQK03638.1 hypothetical protein FB599_3198 [Herbaspirillum sp. SJZ130]TQK08370.1 hypothetical protein FB598_3137 [Herbaspirillum sp. SJZ106]TWC71633.1 hypothetical protein FB597_101608 [Herbaspirillum sp. SJZ099]
MASFAGWRSLTCAAALLSGLTGVPAAAGDAAVAPAASLQQSLMARAVVLRGDIDGRQIQLSLQPKKNEDGLEGRYFFFGGSPEILVAGEVEGDDLVMEESVNGKDVSGQWEGHRQGNAISGTWSNADGSVTKPFSLQLP